MPLDLMMKVERTETVQFRGSNARTLWMLNGWHLCFNGLTASIFDKNKL